ncbi:hypothetical protein LSM04_008297 [Trypanosoma melophagium]|uniref:uncharacterized protein n=1 Tax=Trypanosoma melophagium TaxID=715481 RepID=UPI00351A3B88|nr:hypothetical protein LSM04_008297 [Trypanosoma melophagium]
MGLMRSSVLLGSTGGLIIGSIVLAACLLLIWCGVASPVAERFNKELEPSLLTETLRLAAAPKSVQEMNLANIMCFAIMVILVVVVGLLDEAMIIVKESIETKAKLPSSELVAYINHSYEDALARSGVAHKVKQMKRVA